jgi:cell division protein FtsN
VRTAAIAAVLAVTVLLVLFVRRGMTVPNSQNSTPAAIAPAAGRSAPGRQAPNAIAPPAGSGASASPVISPHASSTAEKFSIIVSSFRTRDRASHVAADVAALGLPSSVRSASGWEQVVVGPFSSRPEAVEAQGRLAAAHFADTKVEQAAPTPVP